MTTTSPRRFRARFLGLAAGAVIATGAGAALLPGLAQAAPPSVKPAVASCDNGVWSVSWQFTNSDPTAALVTGAHTTGAHSASLTFQPQIVAAGQAAAAVEHFPAGTTGVVTANVDYKHAGPNILHTSGSWTIGSNAGGVIVHNNCISAIQQSVVAQPNATYPGTGTKISGQCQPNTTGYAYSPAFVKEPGKEFAGVGATPIATGADGKFAAWAMVSPWTKPGHYSVSVRCGGATLGVTAPLDVIPNPNVPGPQIPQPLPQAPPTIVITNPDQPVVVRPSFTG